MAGVVKVVVEKELCAESAKFFFAKEVWRRVPRALAEAEGHAVVTRGSASISDATSRVRYSQGWSSAVYWYNWPLKTY